MHGVGPWLSTIKPCNELPIRILIKFLIYCNNINYYFILLDAVGK
jgi:hypothetical protein